MPRAKTRKSSPQRLRSPSPGMRLVSQVYHRDILWKRGDLVSVVEDNEEYVAQIRAVVLARLAMPGVIVRWLLPGPEKKWEVCCFKYVEGCYSPSVPRSWVSDYNFHFR